MVRSKLRTLLIAVVAAVALAGVPATSSASTQSLQSAAATGFPSVNGNWAAPGPFAVTVEALYTAHTVYRPTTLGENGLRHPVILWGNGTGATPAVYDALLRHWASHGFIVAAANTTQSGSGQQMLAGANILTTENGDPASRYYQKVDVDHIGATGHSQGGGGAIAAGADSRVDTTIPIQPGPQGSIAALHSPMFILAGQYDWVVWPWLLVIPRYNEATHIPAIYGELRGATHATPAGNAGGYRGPMTAWFRFWLMGDEEARGEFFGPSCGQCASTTWSSFRRNARALAIPGPA